MQSASKSTQSSRLATVVASGQELIKEPVREAVREVMAEERDRPESAADDEAAEAGDSDDDEQETAPDSGRGLKVKSLLGLLGVSALAYLVWNRTRTADGPAGEEAADEESAPEVTMETETSPDVTTDDESSPEATTGDD